MLSPDYVPRRKAGVLYRQLTDGCVLYDTDAGKVHTLNLAATYIWLYCDGQLTIAEIASRVREDAGEPEALPSVVDTVERLLAEDLLTQDESS